MTAKQEGVNLDPVTAEAAGIIPDEDSQPSSEGDVEMLPSDPDDPGKSFAPVLQTPVVPKSKVPKIGGWLYI